PGPGPGPNKDAGGGNKDGGRPQQAGGPEVALEAARNGDFARVNEAELEKIGDDKHALVVGRARFRWQKSAYDQNGKIKADDAPIVKALADLTKVADNKDADVKDRAAALLMRGQIRKAIGDAKAARDDFEAGLKMDASPEQKRQLNAALEGLG